VGLLRDWHYIDKAVQIPALSEVIREALIRALFVRDDRVLPKDLIADLSRGPPVTVKVKDDGEVRKLVRVLNGEESTVSLGLSAEDYHYFRTQLGVGRTREFGAVVRPRTLLTYDWIVPEQRGVQLDFTGYAGIEFGDAHRAIAQVGATWKQLYDDGLAKGHLVPFVPTVPLDFAIGDGLYGDAPFASYRGEFASHVNALRTISPFGHRARLGFEEVANNGTAYDLLHATVPLAAEFFIPVAAALRLEAKPAARKTLTYAYDDASKWAVALDKLSRASQTPTWVHVTDAAASKILRPASAADPFTVQVSVGGTATGMAAKEKAIDASMAGFTSKNTEVPNPFDVSPARSSSARSGYPPSPSGTSWRRPGRSGIRTPQRPASMRAFAPRGPCRRSPSSPPRRTDRRCTTSRRACARSRRKHPEPRSRPGSLISGKRRPTSCDGWPSSAL